MVLWKKQPLVVFSLDWRPCAYVLHNVTYNLCSQKKHVILIYHEHHKDKYFVLMQQNTIIIQHTFLYKYRYLNTMYIYNIIWYIFCPIYIPNHCIFYLLMDGKYKNFKFFLTTAPMMNFGHPPFTKYNKRYVFTSNRLNKESKNSIPIVVNYPNKLTQLTNL